MGPFPSPMQDLCEKNIFLQCSLRWTFLALTLSDFVWCEPGWPQMFCAAAQMVNSGVTTRTASVINAQLSLPTNFNYFIYNLQLHYLLPAHGDGAPV